MRSLDAGPSALERRCCGAPLVCLQGLHPCPAEHCEREGATLVELEVPWLCATEAEICDAVDAQLGKLAREHPELQLRYAF